MDVKRILRKGRLRTGMGDECLIPPVWQGRRSGCPLCRMAGWVHRCLSGTGSRLAMRYRNTEVYGFISPGKWTKGRKCTGSITQALTYPMRFGRCRQKLYMTFYNDVSSIRPLHTSSPCMYNVGPIIFHRYLSQRGWPHKLAIPSCLQLPYVPYTLQTTQNLTRASSPLSPPSAIPQYPQHQ